MGTGIGMCRTVGGLVSAYKEKLVCMEMYFILKRYQI